MKEKVEELEKDLIKTSLLWHVCHCSFLLLCGPVEMEEQQLTAPLSSCASLHYDSTCRRRAANDRTFALCHQVTSDKLLLSKLLNCFILCALTASSCPHSHSACDDGLLFSSLSSSFSFNREDRKYMLKCFFLCYFIQHQSIEKSSFDLSMLKLSSSSFHFPSLLFVHMKQSQ